MSRRRKPTQSLRDRAAFGRVFGSRNRWSDSHFLVIAAANDNQPARLGLSVGKKYLKRATQRNRVKRLIRESFRVARPKLFGLDLVVLTKASTDTLSNATIADNLQSLWSGVARWLLRSSLR